MLGQKLCLMTSSGEISSIYKNTTELIFDTFIRRIPRALGTSNSALNKWITPHLSKHDTMHASDSTCPIAIDFTHVGENLCQCQFLPRMELSILQRAFMDDIYDSMKLEKITKKVILF